MHTHTHTHLLIKTICVPFPQQPGQGLQSSHRQETGGCGRDPHPVPALHRLDPLPIALNDHDSVKSHLEGKAGCEL